MIKTLLLSLLVVFCLAPAVLAQEGGAEEINQGAVVDSLQLDNVPNTQVNQSSLDSILSAVFMIAGVLSVVFIIIGGFQMVLSGGDPTGVGQARRTILYAVIGLVVSLSAFVIVRFVLGRL